MDNRDTPPILNRIVSLLIGALIGFIVGKLSKSLEIILIATPVGGLIGYVFSSIFLNFLSLVFKFIVKTLTNILKISK